MSPCISRGETLDYARSLTMHGDETTTQDLSRLNQYKSAAKIKMSKRNGILNPLTSPKHPPQTSMMKPLKNPAWDNEVSMPGIKNTVYH